MNSHIKRYYPLYLGILCVIIALMIGCQSADPKAIIDPPESVAGDYSPSIEQSSKQSSNNPWPWMIATMVQLPCFLLFLSISNSWKQKRGL